MDKEEWLNELDAGFKASSMSADYDIRTDKCATKNCPLEEQWQTQDPYFNKSPYQEPKGSLKESFIPGLVVASFLVAAINSYFVQRRLLGLQEPRLQNAFATSITASIGTQCSAGSLSPDDLQREFESIDKDKNGTISKDKLHDLLINSTEGATLDDRNFHLH